MRGLVHSRTDSGLLVAEHRVEGAAVARALREHDPDLRLVPQFSASMGGQYWAVYLYAGSERPAEFVTAWVNEQGEPLPLSMRLVDRVQELDRNGRGETPSADELNALEEERRRLDAEQAAEDLYDDWRKREGRSALLPRSQSLRAARSRTGYHRSR